MFHQSINLENNSPIKSEPVGNATCARLIPLLVVLCHFLGQGEAAEFIIIGPDGGDRNVSADGQMAELCS
jgi:hypothetical protein